VQSETQPAPPPYNLLPFVESNGPYTGYIGVPTHFSSDGSHDLDGEIIEYLWDFGDGYTSHEKNPNHTYSMVGTYEIRLYVKDNYYATNSESTTCIVKNIISPVAVTDGPYEAEIGHTIPFNSIGSYDPDGEIVSFYWIFGDGNTSHKKNPYHAYSVPGLYNVSLQITDNHGGSNITYTTSNITEPVRIVYKYGNLTVAVYDDKNQSISSVYVRSLIEPRGQVELYQYANYGGVLTFEDILVGSYDFRIEREGYINGTFPVLIFENATSTINVVLKKIEPHIEEEVDSDDERNLTPSEKLAIVLAIFSVSLIGIGLYKPWVLEDKAEIAETEASVIEIGRSPEEFEESQQKNSEKDDPH
jgi:PKD repeat protein